MRIELLWWEGCPSHPEALADLRRVLAEERVNDPVRLVEVDTDEQARAQRFPGSPTIRLDGEDAIAAPEGRAVLADLPRLPAARRPRLADAGPRGPARSREEEDRWRCD